MFSKADDYKPFPTYNKSAADDFENNGECDGNALKRKV